MNEAIENVCVRMDDDLGEPLEGLVPPAPPGDFTVVLGAVMAGRTEREMRAEMEALGGLEEGFLVLMTVLEWVERVFARCREVQEDRGRLRG